MTDPLTPERLAELRDTYERGTGDTIECLLELIAIGSSDWQEKPRHRANWIESLTAYQDEHVALLGEVDRLTAELAEARKHARIAVAQSVRLATALTDAHADRERLIAAILRLKQEPRIPLEAWYAYATVLEMARGTKLGVRDGERPGEAQDAPQPHAERPAAGFAATETPEVFRAPRWPADGVLPGSMEDVLALAQRRPAAPAEAEPASEGAEDAPGPQEPATGAAALRWHYGPTTTDPNPGSMWCYACGGEVWSYKDGTLMCGKCHATEEPDAIAPEDEGTSTADVLAQIADDARTEPRTPEEWCKIHGQAIYDPDGWRGRNAPPWEQPITEAEFWERLAQCTVANRPVIARDGSVFTGLLKDKSRTASDARAYCDDLQGLPETDIITNVWINGVATPLHESDLQAALAALDQQPDGLVTCDHVLTEEAADDLKRRFLAAQHDGTQVRVLDHDCGRDHPNADQMCYPATRTPSIDPGMGILGESYEERRDAYRAARREQHPADPEDGWKPGDIR